MMLIRVKRTHPHILARMKIHYSQPKGFVGRNLCYLVFHEGTVYGAIVGGSCALHLPGRHEFLGTRPDDLNGIVNNIFFHVEGPYPYRNFVPATIRAWREKMLVEWPKEYGDQVLGFETMVEPPRTGECYLRDGWTYVGTTRGETCKRVAGVGRGEKWSGRRVWDTKNLRPKLVFCRKV